MMMKGIYEFYVDYGRHGELSAVFVAEKSDVEKVIGFDVYFDEPLGKHSEVELTLDAKHFTLKTDDQEFIANFEEVMGDNYLIGNVNPIGCALCQMSEDDEDE